MDADTAPAPVASASAPAVHASIARTAKLVDGLNAKISKQAAEIAALKAKLAQNRALHTRIPRIARPAPAAAPAPAPEQ